MPDRYHNPSLFSLLSLCMIGPIPFMIATRPPLAVRLAIFAAQVSISVYAVSTMTLGNAALDYQFASLGFGHALFSLSPLETRGAYFPMWRIALSRHPWSSMSLSCF